MKKMTSSWEPISEVQDIAFKYVKRGEELDTAGLARAANLCFVQFVRFASFPARNACSDPGEHCFSDKISSRLSHLIKVRWARTLLKLGHYADVVLLAEELIATGRVHIFWGDSLRIAVKKAKANPNVSYSIRPPTHSDRVCEIVCERSPRTYRPERGR